MRTPIAAGVNIVPSHGGRPAHEGEHKVRPYHGSMTTLTALSMWA